MLAVRLRCADDLWTPGAFKQLRDFAQMGVTGTCSGCDVAAQCGGGCQAMSLAATGGWHADPFCYRRILNKKNTAI